MKNLIPAFLAFVCVACAHAAPTPSAPSAAADGALRQAVAGSWRSDANKARDQYRHPVETLEFFGLRPDMTVIEIGPGAGWYTEILAPVLKDHGQLITAPSKVSDKYLARLNDQAPVFGHVKAIPFSPPQQMGLGADNSVDMVLAQRVTHDYLIDDPKELAAMMQAAYKVLKAGGILGIEEHRALPNQDAEVSAKSLHRIPEDYLIQLGLDTGFALAGVSEINSNPNDDHSVNVHMLPPDLAGGDTNRAAMLAIGESDRMTLKFVKPYK